ncbi:MAG: sulfatase-like hydrolase/transferase [candidate division WS1 bacterium]|jgi:arylsulfatase A-like enzyme|nr:sulfatase-like hydrolase/transferase [candidate division WS1 bacterium]
MPDQPNVLFIISDQHNARLLGHAGHPQVQTPHLDRLAAEGVRFTRAVTNSPICTPSRMCYFSGQHVHNHGYFGLSGRHPRDLPTVFGHFRDAGYRTASIGKIHCPSGWIEADSDLFSDVYVAPGGRELTEYDEYLRERGLLEDRDDARLQEASWRHQGVEGRPSRLPYEHSVEGWCVQRARRFIEETTRHPWFVQVSLPRPHEIYAPAPEFWDLYDHDDLWLPPSADADLSLKAPHLQATRRAYEDPAGMLFEPKTYEALRLRKQHGYLGCVSHMDHAVGELLDFLADNGLVEDTLVIYTSDHGEYASEFGILEKAPGICGDAICHIPSLWRWPGHLPAGHECEEIIQNVDLAPTLCALCDLLPFRTADGADLTGLLTGGGDPVHRVGVTEHPWSKAVRRGDWRLVYYPRGFFAQELGPESDFGELYDLAEDPWEMRNLYFEPEYQDQVEELRRELLDWTVTTTRVRTTLPAILPPEDALSVDRGGGTREHYVEADGRILPPPPKGRNYW